MNSVKSHGHLELAVTRLLATYPVLGGLMASCRRVEGGTETMAIGMANDGFVLHYAPEFTRGLPMKSLVGVLHHEARHVMFGHVFLDGSEYPDTQALIIATELNANENIPEPLPDGAILLRDYPHLPPDEDTIKRYQRLASNDHAEPQAADDGVALQGAAVCKRVQLRDVNTLDDHGRWGEVRDREELTRGLVDAIIQKAVNRGADISQYEKTLIEQAAKTWGLASGRYYSELRPENSSQRLDWRVILRRFTGSLPERSATYARPPRRFPQLIGVVPGTIHCGSKPRILAVIDSSGSMTDSTLADISQELTHLARDQEIVVVECDAAIHAVYPYKQAIKKVHGRGGTDFRPPLESSFLRKHEAELVVFFTDGHGPAPEKQPNVPVLWVISPGGERPAQWGQCVRMD